MLKIMDAAEARIDAAGSTLKPLPPVQAMQIHSLVEAATAFVSANFEGCSARRSPCEKCCDDSKFCERAEEAIITLSAA